nr:hypothetical protein [Candidatus Sigynarchaeota archaeon]
MPVTRALFQRDSSHYHATLEMSQEKAELAGFNPGLEFSRG